jgi:protein-tyrosine-phosphatase
MIKSILFVCTANLCRSPFAEMLCKKKLSNTNMKINVSSCGINACVGYSALPEAIELAKEDFNIDLAGHLSKPFSENLAQNNDLIVVMERLHKEHIVIRFPVFESKTKLLKEFSLRDKKDYDILDPYNQGGKIYKLIFYDINQCLDGLIEYLKINKLK